MVAVTGRPVRAFQGWRYLQGRGCAGGFGCRVGGGGSSAWLGAAATRTLLAMSADGAGRSRRGAFAASRASRPARISPGRRGGAAAHQQINRHARPDAAMDGVAALEYAAIHRAIPDGDHPFRLRHGGVGEGQRLLQIGRQRAGRQQHVRLAGRRDEPQPEPVQAVDDAVQRRQLPPAAAAAPSGDVEQRQATAKPALGRGVQPRGERGTASADGSGMNSASVFIGPFPTGRRRRSGRSAPGRPTPPRRKRLPARAIDASSGPPRMRLAMSPASSRIQCQTGPRGLSATASPSPLTFGSVTPTGPDGSEPSQSRTRLRLPETSCSRSRSRDATSPPAATDGFAAG